MTPSLATRIALEFNNRRSIIWFMLCGVIGVIVGTIPFAVSNAAVATPREWAMLLLLGFTLVQIVLTICILGSRVYLRRRQPSQFDLIRETIQRVETGLVEEYGPDDDRLDRLQNARELVDAAENAATPIERRTYLQQAEDELDDL